MIDLLDKAASLPVAEAAAVLARVAADAARARRPLTKSASPALLRNLAIGAGVGGAGMGLMGALQGRRRKSVLRDALVGAGLGAGVGGLASYVLPEAGKALARPVATPEEQLARWDEKLPITKALGRWSGGLLGQGPPAGAPDRSGLAELIGPVADLPGGGDLSAAASSRAGAAMATLAGGLHEGNLAALRHRMRPVAETHAGLQEMWEKATDAAAKDRLREQLTAIESRFGRPGAFARWRPAWGSRFRDFDQGYLNGTILQDAEQARIGGAKLFDRGHFGRLYARRAPAGVAAKLLGPGLLRTLIGR